MHDLRGNYILSLNKPRTTCYGLNYFSHVSAKLRNALSDFILTTEFMQVCMLPLYSISRARAYTL